MLIMFDFSPVVKIYCVKFITKIRMKFSKLKTIHKNKYEIHKNKYGIHKNRTLGKKFEQTLDTFFACTIQRC